jgi:hypothetical protein
LSIDIEGKAALARTEIFIDVFGRRISDFLSLLRIDGRWQIVNRCSSIESATFSPEADPQAAYKDTRRIYQLAEQYLRGADEVDLNPLSEALHPDATVAYADLRSGVYQAMSKADYLKFYAGISENLLRPRHEIQEVDVSGNIASLKVHSHYRETGVMATEYLVAMKEADRWQIVHIITNRDPQLLLVSK